MELEPYLFFNGRAEEALTFYRSVFGGEIPAMMRYGESPMAADAGEHAQRIMHATFRSPRASFMASDRLPQHGKAEGDNVSLALSTKDADEGRAVFARLSEGGTVSQPLGPPFWGGLFGSVTDRFGIAWMVNVFD